MSDLLFTLEDFTDAGGYLKNPQYCVEHANKKVKELVRKFHVATALAEVQHNFLGVVIEAQEKCLEECEEIIEAYELATKENLN